MLIHQPPPPKDLAGENVLALGAVSALRSRNVEADRQMVRDFIDARGWNPPAWSWLNPVPEVVVLDRLAPLSKLMTDCAFSLPDVLVVPDLLHLPDAGDLMRIVVSIFVIRPVASDPWIPRRDLAAQFRRAAR